MKIESFYNKKEKKQQFRARFQFNKKEFYPSADTKKELNELIDEIRVQERREKRGFVTTTAKKSGPTVRQLFDRTLAGIEENRHRLKFFERIFKDFLELIPDRMEITDLKKTHFLLYYNWRKTQKGKQSKKLLKIDSIYKELYGIRGAFSKADNYFAELSGFSPPSLPPLGEKKKPNRNDSRRKRIVAKDSELDRLLEFLRQPRAWRQTGEHRAHRIRLAHNLEFRYETGLRRKEVAKLERKNYFPEDAALHDVVRWKTGTVTPFFPLTRRAQQIIEERLVIQPDTNFIFSPVGDPIESDYRTLKEVCAKLGIAYGRFADNGFVPHDLRHNFATEIIRQTDIETARELLGHSNIEQTGGYLHTNEKRLKDAMRRRDGFELRSELVVIYKAVRRGKINARKFIEIIKNLT